MARIVVRRKKNQKGSQTKIVRIRSVDGKNPIDYVQGNKKKIVRVIRKRA